MNATPAVQPAAGDHSVPGDVWSRDFVRRHRKWCEDFVLELRLVDVPGRVIGDRLAEVESHCVETGQFPEEAFGDAAAYGKAVVAEAGRGSSVGVWSTALLSAGQVLVLFVGSGAAARWAHDKLLTYNAVQVVCLVGVVLLVALLPKALGTVIRHPLVVGVPYLSLGVAAGVGAALVSGLALPVIVSLSAAPVAVGLFVVSVLLSVVSYVNLRRSEDPVVSPLVGEPTGDSALSGSRTDRRVSLYSSFVFPVIYVILAMMNWVA